MSESWTSEIIYHEGDAFFEDLLAAVDRAEISITYEVYIFEPGVLSRRLEARLLQAQARGVDVRLLVDSIGSPRYRRSPLPMRRFHPVLRFINKRNHRKICIIDGKVAFLGGMNVYDTQLTSVMGSRAWRDIGVQVTGPPIISLSQAFETAWRRHLAYYARWNPIRSALVRLNHSRLERRRLYADLLKRIYRAQHHVWLTTAYFVPARSLSRALGRAAERGCDIRIITPGKSDVPFVRWLSAAFYRDLLEKKVRIYEYQPTILHAKSTLIDNWTLVGSSNLNHRSLMHDLEVDIVLTLPSSIQHMRDTFTEDLLNSTEVSLESLEARPWIERLLGRILLGIRSWI